MIPENLSFFCSCRQESEGPDAEGTYKFLYETGNGINVEESGYQKNRGAEDESSVSWIDCVWSLTSATLLITKPYLPPRQMLFYARLFGVEIYFNSLME